MVTGLGLLFGSHKVHSDTSPHLIRILIIDLHSFPSLQSNKQTTDLEFRLYTGLIDNVV